MPSQSKLGRLRRAEVASGVCTCGTPYVDMFKAESCKEKEERAGAKQPPPRCEVHPDAEQLEVDFAILWCLDPECQSEDCPSKRTRAEERRRALATGATPVPLALPPAPQPLRKIDIDVGIPEERAAEPAGATQTAEVVPEPQHRPARAPALSLDGMTRDGMRRYRQSCVLCAHAPTEHVDGGQCTQCPCDAFRSNTALGVVLGLPNGQIRAGDMEIEMEVHKDGTR
jgi:hypothetical protein